MAAGTRADEYLHARSHEAAMKAPASRWKRHCSSRREEVYSRLLRIPLEAPAGEGRMTEPEARRRKGAG